MKGSKLKLINLFSIFNLVFFSLSISPGHDHCNRILRIFYMIKTHANV